MGLGCVLDIRMILGCVLDIRMILGCVLDIRMILGCVLDIRMILIPESFFTFKAQIRRWDSQKTYRWDGFLHFFSRLKLAVLVSSVLHCQAYVSQAHF